LISSEIEYEKAQEELEDLRAWVARLANDTSRERIGFTLVSVRSMILRVSKEIADYEATRSATSGGSKSKTKERQNQLVGQTCSGASVSFDDGSVADFFDVQVDRGLPPSRFARIWAHTHPGDCPRPSAVDEEGAIRATCTSCGGFL